jgi:4-amino-4-deoxy-L-arabinose transferase-like glycosyltransferase
MERQYFELTWTWLRQRQVAILLVLLIGWYSLATLPYLGDFPLLEWAQMGIAAPAYKLATQGVYGNDLFSGFYRTETYNYEYMPLYPLLVALSFKILGLGVWQARIVSVLCGLATLVLTFWLGRQLYDSTVGLVAAAALCCLRLSLDPLASGIPLLDIARVLRYDILVPVWVLASCICFSWAYTYNSWRGYLGAGLLAGFATLSHIYGAFILPVLAIALLWQQGRRALRTAPLYLLAAGWLLAILPWAIYVLQDLADYRGQMLRHESRFDLLNPGFYWNNLANEHYRYASWIGGSLRHPVLWPRAGIWLLVVGVLAANVLLLARLRRRQCLSDQLLLVALPVLGLLLALLLDYKRYPYTVLVLPFLALQVAFAIVVVWRWAGQRATYARLALGVLLVASLLEGGVGIVHSLQIARSTTPYLQVTQAITRSIPLGSRILASQPYWLGLARYDVRSINLAFVLSDPHYQLPRTLSMEQVIEQIDPEYVVVEDEFLTTYAQDPSRNPWAVAQWRMFGEYLGRHCAGVDTIADSGYGKITVYRCAAQPAGF